MKDKRLAIYVGAAALVIILLGGGYYFLSSQKSASRDVSEIPPEISE
ncbi:hypothetical protein HYS29_02205, partial [Candidatus Microgenomates bacterium]|nr:hypothetical protein [Candidatus Microgenomates bacterium]